MENRIRDLRIKRRWSQARLAELAGVSRQTINTIERGKYDPSLPLALKLARIFGTPVETIWPCQDE